MIKPFVGDCSVAISPIRGMENKPEVFPTQQQHRCLRIESEHYAMSLLDNVCKQDMDAQGISPRLSSTMMSQVEHSGRFQVPKVPYPFPNVTAYDKIDRDASLLNSLRILETVRTVEMEKRKFEERKKGLVPPPAGKVNKKKKAEESLPGFMFTKDMFHCINSQACLHVLHLLFECYDWKEADAVFRDVWPVYDKKMEGLFRRVALKWMRDIIEGHPQFFSGIKLEALGGLLVNPGGERFVQLIECFTELALFRVVKDNQDHEDVIYEKPNFTNDSEVSNRQILAMTKITQDVFKNTLLHRKQGLINAVETRNRKMKFATRKQAWLDTRNKVIERVNTLVVAQFGNQNILETFNVVADESQLLPFAQPSEKNLVEINCVVDKALEIQTAEALQVVTSMHEVMKKYQRLWFVLEMDRNQERVLDGSRLCFINNDDESKQSMKDFVNGIDVICNEFIQDKRFSAPIPNSILRDFKSADLKFEYLKLVHQEMKKQNTNNNLSSFRENLNGKLSLLKIQLKDINWQEYSKVYDEKLTTALLLTPTKGLDFSKKTGYTPGLINFLNTGKFQTPGVPHPSHDTSEADVPTAQLDDSTKTPLFTNRPPLVLNTSANLCSTPVSRFNLSSVEEKHRPPRVRLSGFSKPQVSFQENDLPTSPSVTVTPASETDELGNKNLNDSREQSPMFNRSMADISVSESSFRSDVSGPHSLGVQARIARIMGSLTRSQSAGSTHSNHSINDDEDYETEGDGDTLHEPNNLDSSLVENDKRLSVSSIRTNYSEFNRSLLDEWNNEKGIMDMSFGNLDESDIVG